MPGRLLMLAVPFLLTAGLGACASVTLAPGAQDIAGKQFSPPPEGQAALYIYREGIFASAVLLPVSVGQRAIGALAVDTWFLVDVPPGTYDVRCTGGENTDMRTVQLAPGETRYVEAAIRPGFLATRCAVFEVAPETGQKAIRAGKRALEIP
ncbi:MAG: hypothetical protein AB7F22_09835 [Reyranella sp.]|uniref:hypothetical protein n=1 Tax=Reyranella sp. TaxID=1929291 RepID=UPI003D120733